MEIPDPLCFGDGAKLRLESASCLECASAIRCLNVVCPPVRSRPAPETELTFNPGMAAVAAKMRPKEVDQETDPNGLDPHAPGAKLDAGKVRPDLILDGFSLALWAVAEVGTYGAKKYTENGWASVDRGEIRYRAAAGRHRLKRARESHDPDTQLLHLAHEAWNVLAELELHLRKESA